MLDTQTLDAGFYDPAHASDTHEFVVMALLEVDGRRLWQVCTDPARPAREATYPTQALATEAREALVDAHWNHVRAYEQDLRETPMLDTAERSWLSRYIEEQKAKQFAVFTRTVTAFTPVAP